MKQRTGGIDKFLRPSIISRARVGLFGVRNYAEGGVERESRNMKRSLGRGLLLSAALTFLSGTIASYYASSIQNDMQRTQEMNNPVYMHKVESYDSARDAGLRAGLTVIGGIPMSFAGLGILKKSAEEEK